ncbi:MAG: acetylglutamate kinase [Longimicrobiales bacterium]
MKDVQVVKVGGAALNDPQWLDQFAQQAHTKTRRVIVHGGGPEVSGLSMRLGVDVTWNGGRRVTSAAALDVAAMVLTGRINKRIVRALGRVGVDAIGLSGEDGRLLTAGIAQQGALGLVGEIAAVRVPVLEALLGAGFVPVISPISSGPDGCALNVNADEVATAVATAVGAQELLFLTDVPAVRDQAGARAELSTDEARALITDQVATGGMAVKLSAALLAVEAGVARVRVGPLEMLNDATAGTLIRREEALACP